jgi:hypothetical protein
MSRPTGSSQCASISSTDFRISRSVDAQEGAARPLITQSFSAEIRRARLVDLAAA